MPSTTNAKKNEKIRRAFEFLVEKARDGRPFGLDDLQQASGWTEDYTRTNLSKRLDDFIRTTDDQFFARPEILRVRFADFNDLFRQKQRLFADYVLRVTPHVLVYEFFLPLSREDRLRDALDNLFYRDSVEQRIREIGLTSIREGLKLEPSCSDEQVHDLVCDFVGDTIGGYSLSIVYGRFRAATLATRSQVATRQFAEGPYLFDEMTAIVRFILPVDTNQEVIRQPTLFEPAFPAEDVSGRARQMRWLFLNFFAEAVTRVVRKEDEIWLLESGLNHALYRWVRSDK